MPALSKLPLEFHIATITINQQTEHMRTLTLTHAGMHYENNLKNRMKNLLQNPSWGCTFSSLRHRKKIALQIEIGKQQSLF